jgi:hypothetical protein
MDRTLGWTIYPVGVYSMHPVRQDPTEDQPM